MILCDIYGKFTFVRVLLGDSMLGYTETRRMALIVEV